MTFDFGQKAPFSFKSDDHIVCTNCHHRNRLIPLPELAKGQLCSKCGTPLPHYAKIEVVSDMEVEIAFTQDEVRFLQLAVHEAELLLAKGEHSSFRGDAISAAKTIMNKLLVPFGDLS